jgi:hypothetical protein
MEKQFAVWSVQEQLHENYANQIQHRELDKRLKFLRDQHIATISLPKEKKVRKRRQCVVS